MVFRTQTPRTLFLILLALCLCVRIGHWSTGRPKIYPDTAEYLSVAHAIETGDFTSYTGERTPVYPLFLLLAGADPQRTWILHSILGIASSLLLFSLVFSSTRSPVMALLAGLAQTLSINVIFFEAAILTETLSTFLLLLSLFMVLRILRSAGEGRQAYAFAGVAAGLAALVKPLLLFVPFLLFLFLLLSWRSRRTNARTAAGCAAAFLIPAFILVGGWSAFNKASVDYFGTSTLAGYNLTQHTVKFIDDAPPEYASIRDTLIRYRDDRIRTTGSASFAVFDARQSLLQATGTSVAGLSKLLTALAFHQIARHPLAYARSVFESWISFWNVPLYWDQFGLTPYKAGRIVQTLWGWEQRAIFFLRMAFLAIVAVSAFRAMRSGELLHRIHAESGLWIPAAVVLAGSIVQAFLESGENARYSLPFQSLMIACVLMWSQRFSERWMPSSSPRNSASARILPKSE
jgi:4-amino-4-deoxy-L-arabinose transferase-like glycosyltransferase